MRSWRQSKGYSTQAYAFNLPLHPASHYGG
ncbi:hypothetical protein EDD64_1574, partial [Effusibacillus lacus]